MVDKRLEGAFIGIAEGHQDCKSFFDVFIHRPHIFGPFFPFLHNGFVVLKISGEFIHFFIQRFITAIQGTVHSFHVNSTTFDAWGGSPEGEFWILHTSIFRFDNLFHYSKEITLEACGKRFFLQFFWFSIRSMFESRVNEFRELFLRLFENFW